MSGAVANRKNGKLAGEAGAASPWNGERRYADAIEWCRRLEAFYRWMNDAEMEQLLRVERDRLGHRMDALAAVRLGTLKKPYKPL